MTLQQKNKTKEITNKELSIQISLNGLSFCIVNTKTKTVSYLKTFPSSSKQTPFQILDTLKALFKENTEINNQKFDNVNVIYENELATLVPKPLFKEELLADYLKFNSKILKTDFISYDEINTIDVVNVYVPYVNINNFIYERFGSFTYKHFSTVLIEKLNQSQGEKNDQNIYINVCNSHFEIISYNRKELLLYNTFEYSSKEDFIYYLLFTIEQLNLNPEVLDLFFLGEINKTDPLYEIAYKYIRNVSFIEPTDTYKYNDDALMNSHSNYILLNSF